MVILSYCVRLVRELEGEPCSLCVESSFVATLSATPMLERTSALSELAGSVNPFGV